MSRRAPAIEDLWPRGLRITPRSLFLQSSLPSKLGRGLQERPAMDLLEDLLQLTGDLSTAKIKALIDAIASRVPHQWLPSLGASRV